MNIVNETPFTVAIMLWEDLQGQPKLTVIVKATFAIKTSKPTLADKQFPIFTADEHYRDDPLASVRFESDMVPFKPLADVVLAGRAHAPSGRPVTKLDVAIRVGRLQRAIRILGDRKWWYPSKLTLIPVVSSPEPFITMDLTYERAFGGIDEASAMYCKENPIGKGFIGKKSKDSAHGKPLPNLEDPHNLISFWDSRPKPVGFGFYGRGWMPRLHYAGTYDEKYQKERAPALPHDFSYAIFNGAHPALQVKGYLNGDEVIELKNLSREPAMRFQLPGLHPKIIINKLTVPPDEWIEQNTMEGNEVSLEQIPTAEESVKAVLDTLVLVPDKGIFYEVFRGVCPLADLNALEIDQIKITT
ncbi:MAG: DUF2169 domain-containing protein [Nitrospinota bacterium]